MEQQKQDEDFLFFKEWWGLYKKYQSPPKSKDDVFWSDLVNDCRMLVRKYEKSEHGEFYTRIALDVLNEIERRAKES